MGINIDRFVGDVDSNFICSICNDVLEDPLQAPMCEHAFCKLCISQWLNTNHSCPLDREQLAIGDLRPVSRILWSFISRLTLTCNNQIHGCPAIVALEQLETHLLECSFDPQRLVSCSSGCGIIICFGERANHNCARSLRLEMKETSEILFGLLDVETENKSKMSEIESKLAGLLEKLERVEKANENKMLMIESKLELLEAEMAKLRISMSNSLHIESATLKQSSSKSGLGKKKFFLTRQETLSLAGKVDQCSNETVVASKSSAALTVYDLPDDLFESPENTPRTARRFLKGFETFQRKGSRASKKPKDDYSEFFDS